MSKNQVFIISWPGQHANACIIANALEHVGADIFIVFSDPNPDLELSTNATVIRRDNQLYAGDKLQACMDAFNGEHLFVICADCTCDDWAAAIKAGIFALDSQDEIWVWAPNIHYSGYALKRSGIMNMPASECIAVAHTDTIVFGWRLPVVERIRSASLKENIYGWGIGWMASAFSYSQRKWVVIDPSIKVHHPKSRGYPSQAASAQRARFLMQLDPHEQLMCNLLNAKMLLNDFQNSKRENASTRNL